jgi:tRNA(Ile2)-agmatinylcytidine synthase
LPPMDVLTVPPTYLAFDDTDSPEGMCTTYLATLVVDALRSWDLIGLPRLVRLNPNVPWKTRGNAAVCLALGRGVGRSEVCGAIGGRPVLSFERGTPADPQEVLDAAGSVVEAAAEFSCDNTNPGVVCTNSRPSPRLYWDAVRDLVALPDVEEQLAAKGAVWRKYKNGRGVIGASAAISWRPRDRTWEVIAYRSAERVGTPRDIDPSSVVRMDRETLRTFNNYDHESGHVAIAPSSPCPVLFGIRGDYPAELLSAREMIRGEPPASWLLFLTNQGTDDHIASRRVRDLRACVSGRMCVEVVAEPRTIEGGHVIVQVADRDEIDALFYEPSGRLRDAARALVPGDRITVFGSYREAPRGFNVEKMQVLELQRPLRKARNPMCTHCQKRMGSMGRAQGFRCKRCGARAGQDEAEMAEVARDIDVGWYEPPVASRRHLYRPIRRMSYNTSTTYL